MSILNTFWHSEKGVSGNSLLDLSDAGLLNEKVSSLIGSMLVGRTNLLRKLDEKKAFLERKHDFQRCYNLHDLTSSSLTKLQLIHHVVLDIQMKMMVIQCMFDLYKVITMVAHNCHSNNKLFTAQTKIFTAITNK